MTNIAKKTDIESGVGVQTENGNMTLPGAPPFLGGAGQRPERGGYEYIVVLNDIWMHASRHEAFSQ